MVSLGSSSWASDLRKSLLKAGLSSDDAQLIIDDVAKSYVPWQEARFLVFSAMWSLVESQIASTLVEQTPWLTRRCVLYAVVQLLQELQSGRADMVLTGGMDTFNDISVHVLSKTPALSPTGSKTLRW